MIRALSLAPAVTLAVSLAAGLSACKERESPEAQIQKMLDEGVERLEKGDVAGAGELISEDYADKAGRDKSTLKRIAFFMLRSRQVSFFLRETKIEVSDDLRSATVSTNVIVGARKAEAAEWSDKLPSGVRKMPITLRVAREGDDWRIIGLEGDGLKGGG